METENDDACEYRYDHYQMENGEAIEDSVTEEDKGQNHSSLEKQCRFVIIIK